MLKEKWKHPKHYKVIGVYGCASLSQLSYVLHVDVSSRHTTSVRMHAHVGFLRSENQLVEFCTSSPISSHNNTIACVASISVQFLHVWSIFRFFHAAKKEKKCLKHAKKATETVAVQALAHSTCKQAKTQVTYTGVTLFLMWMVWHSLSTQYSSEIRQQMWSQHRTERQIPLHLLTKNKMRQSHFQDPR